MSATVTVSLTINKKRITAKVSPDLTLADFLHEEMGLSGTKVCCGMGICKACTVAIKSAGDTRLSRAQACVTPVSSLGQFDVLTVEGLAKGDVLHPLQEAFLKHFSFQCGYSSAGFLMGAVLLMDQLKAAPIPKDQVDRAIAESLGDHVCRCTGYVRYYAAIKEVILKTPGLTV
jgi:aerobic-type carbon monoxide dehydrogenase small subunit (CoxS/CutS family)